MELNQKLELEALKNRKEFCAKAMSNYNKKLPVKLLIAFGIGLLYAFVRTKVNPEEKISFYTTLVLIVSFCIVVIIFNYIRLLKRIKKDIKEVDAQIMAIKSII